MLKRSIFENKLVADTIYITIEYGKFYDRPSGARKADYAMRLATHYGEMSTFDQGAIDKKYALIAQNSTLRAALLSPDTDDYFHFRNPAHRPGQSQDAFRRIVVGLWSQENALPLADAVIALFEDCLISPYLDSFKVLLSFNPTKPRPERELLKGDTPPAPALT